MVPGHPHRHIIQQQPHRAPPFLPTKIPFLWWRNTLRCVYHIWNGGGWRGWGGPLPPSFATKENIKEGGFGILFTHYQATNRNTTPSENTWQGRWMGTRGGDSGRESLLEVTELCPYSAREMTLHPGRRLKDRNLYNIFQLPIPTAHSLSSVQSLSRVWLFATPWITARQASLSITNSWSLLKLMSIESVMTSSHLILCRPLLLLPSIPPSTRLFSNESLLVLNHFVSKMSWQIKLRSRTYDFIPRDRGKEGNYQTSNTILPFF